MSFIIMQQIPKRKDGGGAYEPLSYGKDGEPRADWLMRRGQRAASFPTVAAAHKAYKDSYDKATEAGITFQTGRHYALVQVVPVEAEG